MIRVMQGVAFLLVLAVLGGCLAPWPGCGPETAPVFEESYMLISLVHGQSGMGIEIDRQGRSRFQAGHTSSWLTTRGACRKIPAEDFQQIERLWRLLHAEPSMGTTRSSRPTLFIFPFDLVAGRDEDGRWPSYRFRARANQTPNEVEEAITETLRLLAELYGDRLVRELRAGGFEDLEEITLDRR